MRKLYNTPEELSAAVDKYFEDNDVLAITGLALALGFADRQSLYDYEKYDGYSCIIKKARTRVELSYELGLRTQSPTGSIFALKNMGWTDKKEIVTMEAEALEWV